MAWRTPRPHTPLGGGHAHQPAQRLFIRPPPSAFSAFWCADAEEEEDAPAPPTLSAPTAPAAPRTLSAPYAASTTPATPAKSPGHNSPVRPSLFAAFNADVPFDDDAPPTAHANPLTHLHSAAVVRSASAPAHTDAAGARALPAPAPPPPPQATPVQPPAPPSSPVPHELDVGINPAPRAVDALRAWVRATREALVGPPSPSPVSHGAQRAHSSPAAKRRRTQSEQPEARCGAQTLFIVGPPGSGKTYFAHAVARAVTGCEPEHTFADRAAAMRGFADVLALQRRTRALNGAQRAIIWDDADADLAEHPSLASEALKRVVTERSARGTSPFIVTSTSQRAPLLRHMLNGRQSDVCVVRLGTPAGDAQVRLLACLGIRAPDDVRAIISTSRSNLHQVRIKGEALAGAHALLRQGGAAHLPSAQELAHVRGEVDADSSFFDALRACAYLPTGYARCTEAHAEELELPLRFALLPTVAAMAHESGGTRPQALAACDAVARLMADCDILGEALRPPLLVRAHVAAEQRMPVLARRHPPSVLEFPTRELANERLLLDGIANVNGAFLDFITRDDVHEYMRRAQGDVSGHGILATPPPDRALPPLVFPARSCTV